MPNHNDIFRNKIDFAREEFSTELYKLEGIPQPRERKSQKAQLNSVRKHGASKDIKRNFSHKISDR